MTHDLWMNCPNCHRPLFFRDPPGKSEHDQQSKHACWGHGCGRPFWHHYELDRLVTEDEHKAIIAARGAVMHGTAIT